MQNGTITDAQITASSKYNAATTAANARFNNTGKADIDRRIDVCMCTYCCVVLLCSVH